jgi:hypothetical protein
MLYYKREIDAPTPDWAVNFPCVIQNSELKQVTFLTTPTSTGSKVDVFHQSQPLTQSSDVTHVVRVVKNVTCLSSLMTEKRQTSHGYIIRILQHFATKLWNITNFVMLFQAVMKFLSRSNFSL